MRKGMPDFEGWVVFATVAEHRSFARAAGALGLSSGTVSKVVSRLEARVGATLFHRTTRTLSLTPIGRTLVGQAAGLLSDAEAVEDAARDQSAQPTGLVRIVAPFSYGLSHVATLLPELTELYPGLKVNLYLDDAPTDLIGEGFDLAVRIGSLQDSSLKARKLADIRTIVVAAPSYVKQYGSPEQPADLSQHVTLAYSNLRPHDCWTLCSEDGEEARVNVRNLAVMNSGNAMLPLLCAGRAIALMPEFLIADELRTGRLVRMLPNWSYRKVGLHIVTPSSGPRPARVTAVIDFLARQLSGPSTA